MVINATIAKYAHATLRRRKDGRIRIYSHDLNCQVEVEDISGLRLDGEMGLINSVITLVKPQGGFELEVSADFPVGSGLGGSAAVAAAIIGCFNEFRTDPWTRHQIAEIAFQSERLMLNIAGGWQDQYATTFGGFNFMEFSLDQNTIVPLRLDPDVIAELEESLILCYTGSNSQLRRYSSRPEDQLKASQAWWLRARRQYAQKELTREIRRHLFGGRFGVRDGQPDR